MHVDDLGPSAALNDAVIHLHQLGIVTSGSVLYPHDFDYPMDLGIHLRDDVPLYHQRRNKVSHVDCHNGWAFKNRHNFVKYLNFAVNSRLLPMIVDPIKAYKFHSFPIKEIRFLIDWTNYPKLDDLFVLPNKSTLTEVLNNVKPGLTQLSLHLSSDPREKSRYDLYKQLLKCNIKSGFVLTNWGQIRERWNNVQT